MGAYTTLRQTHHIISSVPQVHDIRLFEVILAHVGEHWCADQFFFFLRHSTIYTCLMFEHVSWFLIMFYDLWSCLIVFDDFWWFLVIFDNFCMVLILICSVHGLPGHDGLWRLCLCLCAAIGKTLTMMSIFKRQILGWWPVELDKIRDPLKSYSGVSRRFQGYFIMENQWVPSSQ